MKKTITVDGNEACSRVAYYFTELAGIYPITPSSPMAEHVDEWSNKNNTNIFNDTVKVIEMQSEAGAAGVVHGSLSSGVLTTTFTSSQGLLLMIPNMYKMAGELLPCVIHVAARSLATHALSIFGDHQDVYATRSTGFCILASSSVQDTAVISAIAHLSAIKLSLPFLHFFDGFRTSHELQKIDILEKEDFLDIIDYEAINKFRNNSLNINAPYSKGMAENDDIYFQNMEAKNSIYEGVSDIVSYYMEKVNEKLGSSYKPFNYYGSNSATKVIVAMGSVCETIKETIDYLNDNTIGLIEVHLYRPFSIKYLLGVLPSTVKKIAVLDRTKEHGSIGEPLYLDVVAALKDLEIEIFGGRFGLSSKDTTPAQIKSVYDMLENDSHNNFTIGIDDDVTMHSLKTDNSFRISNSDEIIIYGYGSDGMVSASKTLIKLIGENTNKYVQGYFQYDSKKSGGVTISHLRFSGEKIRSTYYVQNPKLVILSKDSYLKEFNILASIKENGVFLINTMKTENEINKVLSSSAKKIINERNISVYKINAYEIARKNGLGNKISTILETAITKLINILNFDEAFDQLKQYVTNKFSKKGDEIVSNNIKAMEDSINYLEKINIDNEQTFEIKVDENSIFDMMTKRRGNELPVSSFLKINNGHFPAGTSKLEKRGISDIVPEYIQDNCITCNMCSFVCPHSVIRPFLLNEQEYYASSDNIKQEAKEVIIKGEKYYYIIAISVKDCTGCGVCINSCMSKNKALIPQKLTKEIAESKQSIFNYLNEHISNKNLFSINTIKGSQFEKPKFSFCGACSGCGETAYIKLLTQLFGKELIIANATGCSSIYGGSAPITPYSIPWANSLFEDNAEYGLGIYLGQDKIRNRIKKIMENNINTSNKELFEKWISNMDSYEITNEVYNKLDYDNCPKELKELKQYIPYANVWVIGGDGWAYDIGFSGIDHILASDEDINILVLDTQVYSNTGGQASKASPKGAIASFASSGKCQINKDLARIALVYPNAYVAQISLGANGMQAIKAFTEAKNHKGPSIIIAYTPCISHGIEGGMQNSVEMEKLAVKCGYFPIFRRNPEENKFYLDSKDIDFELYYEFLNKQTRYKMLHKVNSKYADKLLEENKNNAIERLKILKSLE